MGPAVASILSNDNSVVTNVSADCPLPEVVLVGGDLVTKQDIAWAVRAAQACPAKYPDSPCLVKYVITRADDSSSHTDVTCGELK